MKKLTSVAFALLVGMLFVAASCPGPKPPPGDDDGDGTPNNSDLCPQQPGPPSNGGCPEDPGPEPTPEPGDMPAKDVAVFPELLVRQGAGGALTRGGVPWKPNGFVQCCMATDTGVSVYEKAFGVKQHQRPRRPRPFRIGGLGVRAEVNSRWPSISPPVMKFAKDEGGADAFETRYAFYRGDPDHEAEWSDIGGPVLPGQWPNRNERWFEEIRMHGYYAGTIGATMTYKWDSWYGKTCKNGSQECDWPAAAINAYGEVFTADHKLAIDWLVETVGCQMNAEWGVGNEEALVPRARREYYEAVAWAFRDAEQRFPCKFPDGSVKPVVHVITTTWPEIGNGPFDIVETHDDGPLTKLYWGKHSRNSERNGTTYTAEQDLAMHCEAWKINGAFYFWRAEDSDELMRQKLALRKAGCAGNVPVGCFLPGPNDPNWINNGTTEPVGGGHPSLRAGMEAIRLEIGERCGAADKYAALDIFSQEARARGYCASAARWGDAVAMKCPDNVENGECVQEFHIVSFQDGCYATNPAVLPKNTWHYNGPLPKSPHCEGVAPIDEILCKPHACVGCYDCTPKRGGQASFPEDDPLRRQHELCAMGNADPTYKLQVTSGDISLVPQPNPMQFKIVGSGTGRVTCTAGVPGTFCNVDVQR